jgi:hypothetical protein
MRGHPIVVTESDANRFGSLTTLQSNRHLRELEGPRGQAAVSCKKIRRAFSAIAAIAGCLILRSKEIA